MAPESQQVTRNAVRTCIVGGGVHGTCVARALREQGHTSADIAVVDPNDGLLASFRRKARACAMPALRSSFVQHLGSDPLGLQEFAVERGRETELVGTVDYPARPSLSLFLDHAESVIERWSLDSVHRQATVEGIERDSECYRVDTTTGPIWADNTVLAIGQGGRYRYPDWAGTDGIVHVWDGFDPSVDGETIVVGGGITAAHLACTLPERGSVTLLSRHPLDWEIAEAAPPWVTWSHIEATLHSKPAGSKARFETVQSARHSPTIPPYLYHDLDTHLGEETLTLEQGTVSRARNNSELSLALVRNEQLTADRVVLATGFEPVFDHPFVDRVADTLGLRRGYRGMPVLDDHTLAWEVTGGTPPQLYVTGALASGTVGPLAANLAGARRASERIGDAIEG